MSTTKIALNRRTMRDILRGSAVQRDLRARAQRVAAAAGPGHEVEVFVGRNRARATVRTVTDQAKVAEEHRKTLTRALEAGR